MQTMRNKQYKNTVIFHYLSTQNKSQIKPNSTQENECPENITGTLKIKINWRTVKEKKNDCELNVDCNAYRSFI